MQVPYSFNHYGSVIYFENWNANLSNLDFFPLEFFSISVKNILDILIGVSFNGKFILEIFNLKNISSTNNDHGQLFHF